VRIFCGAGSASAISAIFNAHLGGIIFATEAIICDMNIRSFVSLVVASIISTATTRILLGYHPLLIAPEFVAVRLHEYLNLGIAGILSGFMTIYFLKTYNADPKSTVSVLKRMPSIFKPAMGGLVVGLIAVVIPTMWETTYTPIIAVINGDGYALLNLSVFEFMVTFINKNYHTFLFIGMAVVTLLIKPISNAITLASGSSDGTFASAIKTGAMFGFCFGIVLQFFILDTNPGLYAVVCAVQSLQELISTACWLYYYV